MDDASSSRSSTSDPLRSARTSRPWQVAKQPTTSGGGGWQPTTSGGSAGAAARRGDRSREVCLASTRVGDAGSDAGTGEGGTNAAAGSAGGAAPPEAQGE